MRADGGWVEETPERKDSGIEGIGFLRSHPSFGLGNGTGERSTLGPETRARGFGVQEGLYV